MAETDSSDAEEVPKTLEEFDLNCDESRVFHKMMSKFTFDFKKSRKDRGVVRNRISIVSPI